MALPKVIAANKIALAAVALAGLPLITPVPAVTGNHDLDRLGVRDPSKKTGRPRVASQCH